MRDGMPLWQAVTSSGTQFFLDRHDIIGGDLKHTLCFRKGLQGLGVGQLHTEDEGPGDGDNN